MRGCGGRIDSLTNESNREPESKTSLPHPSLHTSESIPVGLRCNPRDGVEIVITICATSMDQLTLITTN